MQFRDHPGVQGKRDAYPFDPRLLKVDAGYNVRDLDAADERADLDELKESIRSNGVRVPLEVRLVDEDVFIVAGHRRHKAVMELIGEGEEIKAVPVMPEPKHTSEVDRILNLVVSNSGKPLKPLEIAEVVRRLVAFGWDKAQIAKRIGWKSAASVTQHLELLAMPEPVKAHVREGDISATQASKLLKNLPKGTDPIEAAKLIEANKEENRRLGVGKRKSHKVTASTLKRDAKPKAPETPKEETKPDLPAGVIDTPGNVEAAAIATDDALGASNFIETIAETPPAAAQFTFPKPHGKNTRVDELLLEFISVDCPALAAMYLRLCKERETTAAECGDASQAQEQLCVAADVIGSLRFPDQWEGAKANSELALVA